jgi:predicted nucleic acid-binding Zn ribbon protein
MNTVELLRTWGTSQDAFHIVQVNAETAETWSAQFRTTETTAASGLDLLARKLKGEERVWISFEEAVPEDVLRMSSEAQGTTEILPRLISAINDTRAGSVTCSMRKGDATPILEIQAVIYEDGFSRHVLNMAVLEIAKGYNTIQRQYAELTGAFQLMAQQRDEAKAEMQSSLQQTGEIRCLSCQRANPPGSRFCNQCGAPLTCPSCGTTIPPASRFCNQCGTSLEGRQP